MRQYIILDNDNTSLDDISKEYFDKISEFLDKNIGHSVNNSELSKNDQIREIVFICIKRMKETQINYIKEYFDSFYEKYENWRNETNFDSRISKLYEDMKKEELLNLTYFQIYKDIKNMSIPIPQNNKNNISLDDIRNSVLNTYKNKYKEFKNLTIAEFNIEKKNESIILIKKEIANILQQIYDVIQNSFDDINNQELFGYYTKKHIVNYIEKNMDLFKNEENNNYNFMKNDFSLMDYLKNVEEKLYTEKIINIVEENYNSSLEDYFYSNYYPEILSKLHILLL